MDIAQPSASDPWYMSSTLWSMAVTITSGAWAVVATYRSANPRRRLYLFVSTITPLTSSLDLEIRHGGVELTNPYLITLNLASRGRRDIPKGAFQGDPIQLGVDAKVITMLDTFSTSKSGVHPPPPYEVKENGIAVGPAVISRSQTIAYSLLVDGQPWFAPVCGLADVDGGWIPRRFTLREGNGC